MKLLLFTIIDQTDKFSREITRSGHVQYVSEDDIIGMLSHDTKVRLQLARGGKKNRTKKNRTKKNKKKKNKTNK
jgi:hypothetical protein